MDENLAPTPRRRRSFARFDAALKVEYSFGDRHQLALSRTVSAGGMLLGNSSGIEPNAEVEFIITLPDAPRDPIRVRGRVVGVSRKGTQVQFIAGQKEVRERIRRFAAEKIVPVLSSDVMQQKAAVRRVCELAELQLEFGRVDDAMALYRGRIPQMGADRVFAENMAMLWLEQMSRNPPEDRRRHLLAELDAVCRKSWEVLDSPILTMARERVARGNSHPATFLAAPKPAQAERPAPKPAPVENAPPPPATPGDELATARATITALRAEVKMLSAKLQHTQHTQAAPKRSDAQSNDKSDFEQRTAPMTRPKAL